MSRRCRATALGIAALVLALAACAPDADLEVTSASPIDAPTTTTTTTNAPRPRPTTTTTTDAPEPDPEPATTDATVFPEPATTDYTYAEITGQSLQEIPEYWRRTYPGVYGAPYEELGGGVWGLRPDSTQLPQCGREQVDYETVENNAFYASICDIIAYDDAELIPFLFEEYGPLVVATVFAHEWGHAIQARAGVNEATIIMEQQADCFAGAWVRSMYDDGTGLQFSPDELTAAISGLLFVRDPPGLTGASDPQAHGSAFDRVSAFRHGFNQGAAQCATYPDDPPELFVFPFSANDTNEGNLPLADLMPLVTDSLNDYWGGVYQRTGRQYTPLAGGLVPFGEGLRERPACGQADLKDFYDGNVFYCANGDFIAYDEPGFVRPLHAEVGDFAAAFVIANAFDGRVQRQLASDRDGKQRSLQADCMSGAWVGDIFADMRAAGVDPIALSPGDLDEGVSTFLRFGDRAEPGAPQVYGTPFERLDQFRAGVVGGLAACGI